MSASAFCRSISEFFEIMVQEGLALNMQAHAVCPLGGAKHRVSWVANVSREPHDRAIDLELAEYLRCLRAGDYSVMLNDGSLIQLSFDFDGSEVVANRLSYIPCPVKIELADIQIEGGELYPIEDFILDLSREELLERVCLRAPFRFELDANHMQQGHPVSHAHLGRSSSRIPVAAAMCWDYFARFIFMNFYPDVFPRVSHLLKFPPSYRPNSITEEQKMEVHFAFCRPA